jgi:MerR family transcriptional regulator, light-induced transcriptional regulator
MTSETSPEHHNRASHEASHSRGGGGASRDEDWSATLTDLHQHAMAHKSVRDQSREVAHRQAAGLLSKVVEGHVIPRLVLAHRNDKSETIAQTPPQLDPAIIAPFTDLLVSGQAEDLEQFVTSLLRNGSTGKSLYLELLAPAARLLGVYWEEDKTSFTEVTIGLGRLQSLLYRLSAQHTKKGGLDGIAPKILFLTPEGAQHSFGVKMAEDLFRQAGWSTTCELSASLSTVEDRVSREAFDVVGLSLSVQEHVEQASVLIKQIRKVSINKSVKIMLGGQLVTNNPDLVLHLTADIVARDGMEAMAIAQELGYGTPS